MITVDESAGAANIALWYRDIPIRPEDIKGLEGKITKECLRYLIGKMCLTGKKHRSDSELVCDTYARLGEGFGYVNSSLKRLVNYAHAIDRMQKNVPDAATDILNGKIRISLKDTIIVAKMEPHEISNIIQRLSVENTLTTVIINEQIELREKPKKRGRPKRVITEQPRTSVKDIPLYDPNAQVNALIYTIPSWVSAIDRAFSGTDFSHISPDSRRCLIEEMKKLRDAADTIAALMTEEE